MPEEKKAAKTGCKRKYHSKSKKGCVSCKKRRVKCDESKPMCSNCVRIKLDCGYLDESDRAPKRKQSDADAFIWLPQTQQATPKKSPSPLPANSNAKLAEMAALCKSKLGANLNNTNVCHLVNNIASARDMSAFADTPNLGSLPALAQDPIDLSSLGTLGSQLPSLGFNPDLLAALAHPPVPPAPALFPATTGTSLNMLDLKLMYHYITHVSGTITSAGISDTNIWNHDIPMLAFEFPFLMHALLAFSAAYLSRTESGLDECATSHRGEALRLLREAILDINSHNTDALVASALILIMDSLAKSSAASAWIFHVKGAATILTAVWPLTESSRFYQFISVDLGDLGNIINAKSLLTRNSALLYADLECHDSTIADLFPVPINSPYLITLAYLNKLQKERYNADFILRIFAFPALLEKEFLAMLMMGDIKAMRIMRSYYKLLRSFTLEMKDKVWFLEGVSTVLPVDVEEYAGGAGGMHMMLDFLGGGPQISEDNEVDKYLSMIDPGGQIAKKLIDTNNLPSDITSSLDVMQGDGGLLNQE